MSDYLSLFFTTLNVGVVLAFLVYAIRTYVLPGLYEGFAQQQEEREKMGVHIDALRAEKRTYAQKLKKEEQDVARIRHTIDQWMHDQKNSAHEQQKQYVAYKAKLEQKIHKRMTSYYDKKQERAVVQEALYDVQKTLQKKFDDPSAQSRYIQRVLDGIAKRHS